jgi:hypothetical protein
MHGLIVCRPEMPVAQPTMQPVLGGSLPVLPAFKDNENTHERGL